VATKAKKTKERHIVNRAYSMKGGAIESAAAAFGESVAGGPLTCHGSLDPTVGSATAAQFVWFGRLTATLT
jgi:hypothetical protein